MAAPQTPAMRKNRPKRLLLLGFSAAESADFIELFQPGEVLNKINLDHATWKDLRQTGADMVLCSGDAFEKLLSIPRASVLDDPKLTARQREVLSLLQKGFSNRQIAGATGLNPRAVKNEISLLFRFFGVANRTELAAIPES